MKVLPAGYLLFLLSLPVTLFSSLHPTEFCREQTPAQYLGAAEATLAGRVSAGPEKAVLPGFSRAKKEGRERPVPGLQPCELFL